MPHQLLCRWDAGMLGRHQEGHTCNPPVSYSELKTAFLAAFSSAWRWRTSSAAASWMACRGMGVGHVSAEGNNCGPVFAVAGCRLVLEHSLNEKMQLHAD